MPNPIRITRFGIVNIYLVREDDGLTVAEGLVAADLFTNEFIDESIGLPAMDDATEGTTEGTTADTTDAQDPLLNFFLERYAQAYRAEMEAFVDALAEGKPMPTTVRDGVMALRLAECAVESARTGRVVAI